MYAESAFVHTPVRSNIPSHRAIAASNMTTPIKIFFCFKSSSSKFFAIRAPRRQPSILRHPSAAPATRQPSPSKRRAGNPPAFAIRASRRRSGILCQPTTSMLMSEVIVSSPLPGLNITLSASSSAMVAFDRLS